MAPKWLQKSLNFHFYVEMAVNAKNITKQMKKPQKSMKKQ